MGCQRIIQRVKRRKFYDRYKTRKKCFSNRKWIWLGMTASPERTDGFDIFNLFDHNIAYEIRLQQALKEDMLCPFHYFGITDIEINGEIMNDNVVISK